MLLKFSFEIRMWQCWENIITINKLSFYFKDELLHEFLVNFVRLIDIHIRHLLTAIILKK